MPTSQIDVAVGSSRWLDWFIKSRQDRSGVEGDSVCINNIKNCFK